MKQFWVIFRFELMTYLRGKVFQRTTLGIALIALIALTLPALLAHTDTDAADISANQNAESPRDVVLFGLADGARDAFPDERQLEAVLEEQVPSYDFISAEADAKTLTDAVLGGQCEMAMLVTGPLAAEFFVQDSSIMDSSTAVIADAMTAAYRYAALQRQGIAPDAASQLLSAQVAFAVTELGRGGLEGYAQAYVLIMLLYFAIILYGQFIASSVANEKSNRAMEVLITSAGTNQLMAGKVFGTGFAGLLQFSAILGAALIGYRINQSYWSQNALVSAALSMSPGILMYTVTFFLLGFFEYAFMYGAIGSLASRTEDISTSSLPLILVTMASFFIAMFGMNGGVESALIKVMSYIPLSSPMVMFMRISMSSVPRWEIALSIALLVACTAFAAWLSARIYRVGVLMYGKQPSISEVRKAIRAQRDM